MNDKDAIIKIIGIVINDSYDRELELLRWLFRKLDEVEGKDNV